MLTVIVYNRMHTGAFSVLSLVSWVSSSSNGYPIVAKTNTHKESKGVLVVVYSTEQL
jgi:hypothetical protein